MFTEEDTVPLHLAGTVRSLNRAFSCFRPSQPVRTLEGCSDLQPLEALQVSRLHPEGKAKPQPESRFTGEGARQGNRGDFALLETEPHTTAQAGLQLVLEVRLALSLLGSLVSASQVLGF